MGENYKMTICRGQVLLWVWGATVMGENYDKTVAGNKCCVGGGGGGGGASAGERGYWGGGYCTTGAPHIHKSTHFSHEKGLVLRPKKNA